LKSELEKDAKKRSYIWKHKLENNLKLLCEIQARLVKDGFLCWYDKYNNLIIEW